MDVKEKLNLRSATAKKSLACLKRDLVILQGDDADAKKYYEQLRNSAIKSFDIAIDMFGKFLTLYLEGYRGSKFEFPRPKMILQEALHLRRITRQEYETLLNIVEWRNTTAHTYSEEQAEEIVQMLPEFYEVMNTILQRIPSAEIK